MNSWLHSLALCSLALLGCSQSGSGSCRDNPSLCGSGTICDRVTQACVVGGDGDLGVTSGELGAGSADMATPGVKNLCSRDGYCWENPLPLGNSLADVWGADSSHVWAVGSAGTILTYDGSTWRGQPSGVTASLYGVWGTDASHVWAVGEGGTILRYEDARV